MGFFNLLETFFFISLAVTFVLIMMLVYHFKGRLVLLEEKCNTMYEIMNSMVKEMKIIHAKQIEAQAQAPVQTQSPVQPDHSPAFSPSMPFGGAAGGLFPPELFRLFQMGGSGFPSGDDSYEMVDDEDVDGEEGEQTFKKIVVSDTELSDNEDEDSDDNNVKVINITNDIDLSEPTELTDLEEEDIVLDDIIREDDQEGDQEGDQEQQNLPDESDKMNYRKMDVSYLRTMVLTRGLAMDTKKLKKSELIRLLEQSSDL
jgi:hypothetical protein